MLSSSFHDYSIYTLICFKVIPPNCFEPDSIEIHGNKILRPVVTQRVSRIRKTEFCMLSNYGETKMTYSKFIKETKQSENGALSTAAAEDLFWDSERKNHTYYAVDNDLTLFGTGCKYWNLGKFTQIESCLHRVNITDFFLYYPIQL